MSCDWTEFSPRERATLLFVFRWHEGRQQVLLIRKKRGLGAGKINAPGGRLEPGETEAEAALRECREEVCLSCREPEWCGRLQFQFTNGYSLECTVFRSERFEGEMTETDEAVPAWYDLREIPYDQMWADDRLWLPLLLERRLFHGQFVFDEDTMVEERLVLVSEPQTASHSV